MSDEEILTSLRQGGASEEKVLVWLYKSHFPMVHQYIIQNRGSKDDAQDLFQDALIAFTENVKSQRFRGESKVKTYLMSICTNQWNNRLKRKGRDEKYVAQVDTETSENPFGEDPIWLEKEMEIRVEGLLSKLGEKCRRIMTLRFYDKKKFKDIAAELEYKNDQIAKNKFQRCMAELRALLDEDGDLSNYLRGLLS